MLHAEQLAALAWAERRIRLTLQAPKITSVLGKSLWPEQDMRVSCTVKPLQGTINKVRKGGRRIVKTCDGVTVGTRILSTKECASENDKYVAMFAAMTQAQEKRKWL
jgi:hypothetical protein